MPRLKWRRELKAVCLGVCIMSGFVLYMAAAGQHPIWGAIFAVTLITYLMTNEPRL